MSRLTRWMASNTPIVVYYPFPTLYVMLEHVSLIKLSNLRYGGKKIEKELKAADKGERIKYLTNFSCLVKGTERCGRSCRIFWCPRGEVGWRGSILTFRKRLHSKVCRYR